MNLKQFFEDNNKIAIAFSGGVDSAYLLYEAKKQGANAMAYYVKTQFQPQFEYEDAIRLTKELNTPIKVIELDILKNDAVRCNDEKRCYHCKKAIFSSIINEAKKDGFDVILDGTNASDDANDRPGMVALKELKVLSPLKLCDLTKDEIRKRSKDAGLFTWCKPAYACLATRIKPFEEIEQNALQKVEKAEGYMMSLGFAGHRVRVSNDNATILVRPEQEELYIKYESDIIKELSAIFNTVTKQKS